MRRLSLGLALLAVTGAAAGAQQATSGQGQGDFTLEPGQQFHPIPTSLALGDAIAFDWRVTEPAGASLYFSQHIHIGAQQLNITDTTAPSLKSRLVADREGLYSILWENRGTETTSFTYEYHAERAQAPAPASTPLPAALAPLALAGTARLLARRR